MTWTYLAPLILLAGSNLVMNLAWYGHLKAPNQTLWIAVVASWGIAFFEYCLAVPANRMGAQAYSLGELKAMQEVLSISAFVLVAWVLFGQRPGLNEALGFALIGAGAWVIFKGPFR